MYFLIILYKRDHRTIHDINTFTSSLLIYMYMEFQRILLNLNCMYKYTSFPPTREQTCLYTKPSIVVIYCLKYITGLPSNIFVYLLTIFVFYRHIIRNCKIRKEGFWRSLSANILECTSCIWGQLHRKISKFMEKQFNQVIFWKS